MFYPKILATVGGIILSVVLPQVLFRDDYEVIIEEEFETIPETPEEETTHDQQDD